MPNIKPNRYMKTKRYYIEKFEKNPFELVSNKRFTYSSNVGKKTKSFKTLL